MITQTLHQNWTLDMPGMGKLPAAVPGSVYADLLGRRQAWRGPLLAG